MLCNICQTITPEVLAGEKPFKLHKRWNAVVSSEAHGCCFCKWIANDKSLARKTSKFGKGGVWAQGSSAYAWSRARSRTGLRISTLSETGE